MDSFNGSHPTDLISAHRKQLPPKERLVRDLREEADYAVATRWANFEEDHPRLAAVLSRPVLVRAVQADLLDDDSFHKAMHTAKLQRDVARTLKRWVRWSTNKLMKL